jgi:hypothetical protein
VTVRQRITRLMFDWRFRHHDKAITKAVRSGCTQAIHRARMAKQKAVHASLKAV